MFSVKTNIFHLLLIVFSMRLAVAQGQPASRNLTAQGNATGSRVILNQIDTSAFPKVIIFATVLRDGTPVQGLEAKDFRVREDEVDQEPLTVTRKLAPLTVAIALDTSGSMKKRLPDAQAAAKAFLQSLRPEDQSLVFSFSREVKTISPLGADRSAAEAAIGGAVARGDTALYDALYTSVESLRTVPGRKAVILLSDGADDNGYGKPLSQHTLTEALTEARQVNAPIYAVGVGVELDEKVLSQIAGETGALYSSTPDAGELRRLYDNIGQQLAGQYKIDYTSNLPADGSEHRVQLTVGSQTGAKSYQSPAGPLTAAASAQAGTPAVAELPDWVPVYPDTLPEKISVVDDPAGGRRIGSYIFLTNDGGEAVLNFYEDQLTRPTWRVSAGGFPREVESYSDIQGRKVIATPEAQGGRTHVRVKFEETRDSTKAPTIVRGVPPAWLPAYPGAALQNVSCLRQTETGISFGSFFFFTRDDNETVLNFYRDGMPADWRVDIGGFPREAKGDSQVQERRLTAIPQTRGGQTRVRINFEEKTMK